MKKVTAIALTGALFDLGVLTVPAAATPVRLSEPAPAQAGRLRGKVTKPGADRTITEATGGRKKKVRETAYQKRNGAERAAIPAAPVTGTAGTVKSDLPRASGFEKSIGHRGMTAAPVPGATPKPDPAQRTTGDGKADIAVFRPSNKKE